MTGALTATVELDEQGAAAACTRLPRRLAFAPAQTPSYRAAACYRLLPSIHPNNAASFP